MRRISSIMALFLTAACASHPVAPALPQPFRQEPTITIDPRTQTRSITLAVVIYNVAGLPWPIRSGTGSAMKRIGTAFESEFSRERPELLLLQEAFVPSSIRLPSRAGYRNFVLGPSRSARSTLPREALDQEFLDGRRRGKGERSAKLLNAGLVLATEYEISALSVEPFGPRNCAGFDCMSNKGLMLVRINIPGVPAPLFILNTHLNARGASGVSRERSRYAHNRQVDDLIMLLERDWRGQGPLIYAGDFNTRNAPSRFEYKDSRLPGELAHRFCHANRDRCQVKKAWDNDEPWTRTQDLQGYADGAGIRIEPIEIAALFDHPVDGKMLSDHNALRVKYRISWDLPKGD